MGSGKSDKNFIKQAFKLEKSLSQNESKLI